MEKYQQSPVDVNEVEKTMSDSQDYESQDRERLVAEFNNHDEYKKIRNQYNEIKKVNGLKTDEERQDIFARIEKAANDEEKEKLQNTWQDLANKDCIFELKKIREKAIPLSFDFLNNLSDGSNYKGEKGLVNKISLKGVDRRDMEVIFSAFLLKYPSLSDELIEDSLDKWGLSSDVRALLDTNSGLMKNRYYVKYLSNIGTTAGSGDQKEEEFNEEENSTTLIPWTGDRKIKIVGKLNEIEIDSSERPSASLALLAEYVEEAGGKVQYVINDEYGKMHVYESPADVKKVEKFDEKKLVYQTGNGETNKIKDVLDDKTKETLKNIANRNK